ncbi:hypothetical protein HAX54_004371, partial [Datura stramonium]|nr:hypothetical protein [Datura stramonium]
LDVENRGGGKKAALQAWNEFLEAFIANFISDEDKRKLILLSLSSGREGSMSVSTCCGEHGGLCIIGRFARVLREKQKRKGEGIEQEARTGGLRGNIAKVMGASLARGQAGTPESRSRGSVGQPSCKSLVLLREGHWSMRGRDTRLLPFVETLDT